MKTDKDRLDEFAHSALIGLLTQEDTVTMPLPERGEITNEAYRLANEMLLSRKKALSGVLWPYGKSAVEFEDER